MRFAVSLGLAVASALFGQDFAFAAPPTSITANGFGTTVTFAPGGLYNITGGTAAGGNLFHSFSGFNLGTGDTADFVVNNNVSNILARVTGGASSIDGTITSTVGLGGPISSANLFFLNPAGVLFTSNAQVNLGGSFIVSTASVVNFSDGTQFYGDVNHPLADAGLRSAPISAFGFLGATPQAISFNGAQLTNAGGIHLIGGDITVDQGITTGTTERGTTLLAPSGNLTLFSAASAGTVPFTLATPGAGYAQATTPTFGNITLQNESKLGIDSANSGGHVVIRGGHLLVDNSRITSANTGNATGGNIDVTVDSLTMQNSTTATAGATTDANNAEITATTATPLNTTANGQAGDVTVTVTGQLSLSKGALIGSITIGSGNAGDVSVTAGTLTLDGSFYSLTSTTVRRTEIESITSSYFASLNGTALPAGGQYGNGGTVRVNVDGPLSLTNGAQITTNTDDNGAAEALSVTAGTISVSGVSQSDPADPATDLLNPSNVGSNTFGAGNAGPLSVSASEIDVDDGGEINSGSSSTGHAGSLTLDATTLNLSGNEVQESNFTYASGLFANSGSSPFAGVVTLNLTGNLSMTNGAEIADNGPGGAVNIYARTGSVLLDNSRITSTNTGNAAGSTIDVEAESLTMQNSTTATKTTTDANNAEITTIASTTASNSAPTAGTAGTLTVHLSGPLSLKQGAEIASETNGLSKAGDVSVTASSVALDGAFYVSNNKNPRRSEIASLTGSGITGLTGSALPSNETYGNAGTGTVTVTDGGSLNVTGGAQIATSTTGNGGAGDLSVTAGTIEVSGVTHYSLGTSNDAIQPSVITSDVFGSGNAGTLTVKAKTGAGSINIDDGGEINSSANTGSGNAEALTISANTMSIDGEVVIAPEAAGPLPSGVFADARGSGKGGDIMVTISGALSLSNNGVIDARAFSTGSGGTANVTAGTLTIDGSFTNPEISGFSPVEAGIYTTATNSANPRFTGQFGAAGSVSVTVPGNGALSLINGGRISSSSNDNGKGGAITVVAGTLTVEGIVHFHPGKTNDVIQESAITGTVSGTGNAENISVTAHDINILAGGEINSGTSGFNVGTKPGGSGGTLTVTADNMNIDGEEVLASQLSQPLPSGIYADTRGTGTAGVVIVNVADALSLTNGGVIDTRTFNTKSAGTENISAGTLTIDGEYHSPYPQLASTSSAISSSALANSTGSGGTVTVTVAGGITMTNDGLISASSVRGKGGDISIRASSLSLESGARIDTSAAISGGSVTIDVGGIVYLLDSQISASAGTAGGNILIDPQFVVLDDSLLSANAAVGQGGNISIITSGFMTNESSLTATGTTNGTIEITSPDLYLSGSLAVLPTELESNDKLLREKCARAGNKEFSSFILVGRGGTESAPEELHPDFGFDEAFLHSLH